MSDKILEKFRRICLSFPHATEKEAWGSPTFRVREKLFAMWVDHHHGDEHVCMWCKAPGGVQEILVGADPRRFFRPPYVGHKGWIGLRLDVDVVDWEEVRDLLKDSYMMTLPKRMLAQFESGALSADPRKAKTKAKAPGKKQ